MASSESVALRAAPFLPDDKLEQDFYFVDCGISIPTPSTCRGPGRGRTPIPPFVRLVAIAVTRAKSLRDIPQV